MLSSRPAVFRLRHSPYTSKNISVKKHASMFLTSIFLSVHFSLHKKIAGAGFEPATFGLWARRASRLLHPAIELTSLKVIMDGGEFEPFCYHFNNFNSELPLSNWMEVDSNHRSNLQQIYSLSPLATRESIQKYRIFNCTILYWFLNTKPMIGLEPITCWLQISCSANWATSA